MAHGGVDKLNCTMVPPSAVRGGFNLCNAIHHTVHDEANYQNVHRIITEHTRASKKENMRLLVHVRACDAMRVCSAIMNLAYLDHTAVPWYTIVLCYVEATTCISSAFRIDSWIPFMICVAFAMYRWYISKTRRLILQALSRCSATMLGKR